MKQTILSDKESKLLERLIVKYGQIVSSKQIFVQAKSFWGYQQAKNLITKLVKNGWLVRVKKGLYVIADLSTRGFLSLSPYLVANLLVKDSYVSFESALQYYGMFDQSLDKTISVSLKAYKTSRLGSMEYTFVKTKKSLFFGWQEIKFDNQLARLATAEKALIDIVNFHKSKYAIDLVIEKLQTYRADLDLQKFVEYLSHFSFTTIKIFGLIFDLLDWDSQQLYNLIKTKNSTQRMLKDSKKFNAKWRLYYDEYFDKYKIA